MKEARSVYLKEENERQQVEERETRERESKRDDDDDDDDGVKFHSAGPRERHSFFPRRTKHNTNEKRKREKQKRKREKRKATRVPARSHRRVVAF